MFLKFPTYLVDGAEPEQVRARGEDAELDDRQEHVADGAVGEEHVEEWADQVGGLQVFMLWFFLF